MSSPCPKCGATKTDPVRHGLRYKLVWAFGYRLHRCAGCRGPRFIPRHDGKSPRSLELGKEAATVAHVAEERGALKTAEEKLAPKVTKQVTAADSSNRGLRCCPVCGSTQYHRTKRTTLEHLLLRRRMARCENCGLRFPYHRHRDRSSGSVKLKEAVATLPRSAEEKRLQKWPKRTPSRKLPSRLPRQIPRTADCAAVRLAAARNTTVPSAPPWNTSCCAHAWPAARSAGCASPILGVVRNILTH